MQAAPSSVAEGLISAVFTPLYLTHGATPGKRHALDEAAAELRAVAAAAAAAAAELALAESLRGDSGDESADDINVRR